MKQPPAGCSPTVRIEDGIALLWDWFQAEIFRDRPHNSTKPPSAGTGCRDPDALLPLLTCFAGFRG